MDAACTVRGVNPAVPMAAAVSRAGNILCFMNMYLLKCCLIVTKILRNDRTMKKRRNIQVTSGMSAASMVNDI